MTKIFLFFQKYGLLLVLLNCWGLLEPDLSPKTALPDIDLGSVNEARSGGDVLKQLSWFLPMFFYGLCLIKDGIESRISWNRLVLLFGFLGILSICFLSIIWSDFPALTFKRVVFQAIFASVITLSVMYSLKHNTLVICINILFYSVLFVCFLTIINGSGVLEGDLFAWASSKNNFGAYILCLMALFYLAESYYSNKSAEYWVKLGVLFLLLIASGSKTSIALAVFLFISGFISYGLSKILFTSLTIIFSFIFLIIPFLTFWYGSYWDVSFLMEPETLTGRGLIWDRLYYGITDYGSLLSGHGYGAYFGTGIIPFALDDSWSFVRFLNSAHNGYLELLLQVGWICSLLIIFALYKLVCYTESSRCFIVASIVMIHNITESSLVRDQHVIWSLLILLVCIGIFNREKKLNEPESESHF